MTTKNTTKKEKPIHYGNSSNAQKQYIKTRINQELGNCQSMLIDMLLEKGIFEIGDIENFYWRYEDAIKYGMIEKGITEEDYEAEPQEIFEWWPINDSYLKDELIEQGEPVLSNDYGDWWGRTCTGQSIELDPTFWDIFQDSVKNIKDC